jgi:hypothetical protein
MTLVTASKRGGWMMRHRELFISCGAALFNVRMVIRGDRA